MSVLHSLKARLFKQESRREFKQAFKQEGVRSGEAPQKPMNPNPKIRVVMYSTRFCPFCMRARSLLQQKQVAYKDIAVDGSPMLRQQMIEKSGRFTVPQIWIGEKHVGGCDDLVALERSGELDRMLTAGPGEAPGAKQ